MSQPPKHPNVLSIESQYVLQKDGYTIHELIVITDLALDALADEYQKDEVDSLLNWSTVNLVGLPTVDRVTIKQRALSRRI